MKLVFFLFFQCLIATGFAQSERDQVNMSTYLTRLKVNNQVADMLHFPFSSIQILDFRQDTTKIGFIDKGSGQLPFKKLVLEGGFQSAAEHFYNEYYQSSFSHNGDQLLIVVKKFWVNPLGIKANMQGNASSASSVTEQEVSAQYEFFLRRKDEYLPIKRVDTIFRLENPEVHNDFSSYKAYNYNFYEFAMIKMAEQIEYQFYSDRFDLSHNRKKLEDILKFYEGKTDYPIVKDSVLKKGVYLSFAEFVQNKPSLENFRVERGRSAGKALYDGSAGTQILNYWGYCDGRNIYCYDLNYALKKAGNGFDYFAEKREQRWIPSYYYPGTFNRYGYSGGYFSTITIIEPHQLDMTTGNPY